MLVDIIKKTYKKVRTCGEVILAFGVEIGVSLALDFVMLTVFEDWATVKVKGLA